jgi:hypothetical protein
VTERRYRFAELILQGKDQGAAYRTAYEKPTCPPKDSYERGSKLANCKEILGYLNQKRQRRIKGTLLSLDDRLKILAEIATDEKAKQADKVAALKEYARQAGDLPMQVQEVRVTGADGGPVQTEVTGANGGPIQVELTVQQKIAQFVAARGGVLAPSISEFLATANQ